MRASSVTWWWIRTALAARAASRVAGNGSRPGAASGAGRGSMATAGEAARLVGLAGGDPEAVRGEHVTAAAAEGRACRLSKIMTSFGWWVALGLANLANALDPTVIVLGGGLISAGTCSIGPTRRAFADLVEAPVARLR